MLRDLIAWVLNNYLGKYVGNLNTAQLSIALLSGEVELENLPLRPDALRSLGLPLQAVSGNIGKVKLQIPVRQFRSRPWVIKIEKVCIVIGPQNLEEWDAVAEANADVDYKLSRLERLETKWRARKEAEQAASYYASSYSSWLNFGSSFITNVVENLQLEVNDVHIRYEDTLTIPNQKIACGITLDSLIAQSCDSNWEPVLVNPFDRNNCTFKLVQLHKFCFYWDVLTEEQTFSDTDSKDLVTAMEKLKGTWKHQYIIAPVTGQAQIKKDQCGSPLRTRSRPRLTCDIIFHEVLLTLNDWQYNSIVECTRGLDNIEKLRRFRLLRPKHAVHEGAKDWWIYMAQCHGYLLKSTYRNKNVVKENLKYIDLYTRIVRNPNEVLSVVDKEYQDMIEKHRTFEELKALREVCMARVPTLEGSMIVEDKGKNVLVRWFPDWIGWYGQPSEPQRQNTHDNGDSEQKTSSDSIEDELLNALADSVETTSLLKRDAVFGKFTFTLRGGSLDICSRVNDENLKRLQLQFANLILKLESRPRSASYTIVLSLGSFYLKDLITNNPEFPDLIKPQSKELPLNSYRQQQKSKISTIFSMISSSFTSPQNQVCEESLLFQLCYEQKPLSCKTDYRLAIKSQSLDVVYNIDVLNWIIDFISKPHQQISAKRRFEEMKLKTKKELIKNWEMMLEGNVHQRKTWTYEIDISAPQIIFCDSFKVESNISKTLLIVDFGRLQLNNKDKTPASENSVIMDDNWDDSEDEAFMTPCSTAPDSRSSTTNTPTLCTAASYLTGDDTFNSNIDNNLTEGTLHDKIYNTYNIDLTEMQVLVCKGCERWSVASNKATSSMHLLDRFNISLQMERRIVYTMDPQYPSFTVSGTLPKLVAHVNEQKLLSISHIINVLFTSLPNTSSPNNSPSFLVNIAEEMEDDASIDGTVNSESSKLVAAQFAIDQMVLDVQSRGRSISELQVSGVKACYSKRPEEVSIQLSVHGLLLVDGIQSFGQDFELLVASHRHVGMDSISGSLKQSEPCSPNSPGSPDSYYDRRPTSPHTISRALSNLQRANATRFFGSTTDIDALITVEITLVNPQQNDDDILHLINIHFNNLDIIANQETIVELIGFINRVFPKETLNIDNRKSDPHIAPMMPTSNSQDSVSTKFRTQINFDFNRLNVLVLRALLRDSYMVGRKVGTFTLSEAKINATLDTFIKIDGSLGGLQILDLTPEGISHQRILSIGKDPLTEVPDVTKDFIQSLTEEVYSMGSVTDKMFPGKNQECKAFTFRIYRDENVNVEINIRMASMWYTHCARFIQELSWCATEFRNYFKSLAQSIKEKATDMALGLVQTRGDYVGTPHQCKEKESPRYSAQKIIFGKGPNNQSPDIELDIVMDTPVVVLPRSSSSSEVFVAHLGKISINNIKSLQSDDDACDVNGSEMFSPIAPTTPLFSIDDSGHLQTNGDTTDLRSLTEDMFKLELDELCDNEEILIQHDDSSQPYIIDIRNMNLYSLDTVTRKGFSFSALPRTEEFYSCEDDAIPVLHDTAIHLEILRKSDMNFDKQTSQMDWLDTLEITGSVIEPLQVSLSRQQYEQLLETVENVFKVPDDLVRPPNEQEAPELVTPSEEPLLTENDELYGSMKIRRRLFESEMNCVRKREVAPKIKFGLPTLIMQLKSEKNEPLIDIIFRDFNVNYERVDVYNTMIQISLRSVLMEDLKKSIDSKHREMVISTRATPQPLHRNTSIMASHSCPNLVGLQLSAGNMSGSLPNNLEDKTGFSAMTYKPSNMYSNLKPEYPGTPPPSPSLNEKNDEENLVIYTCHITDPKSPKFLTEHNGVKQLSSIDFNSLDLIISVESWVNLLNFFGLISEDDGTNSKDVNHTPVETEITTTENSELDISVRSLTLVLIQRDYEMAKANVSNANFIVSKRGESKIVEGKLGSITLCDLTPHGVFYREKFTTSGMEALRFTYTRRGAKTYSRSLNCDADLKLRMSSVRYIHTKRFIAEIQEFFRKFQQLQTIVFRKLKPSESKYNLNQRPMQLGLDIKADSPIILLPMSANSQEVIIADLGRLSLKNNFHLASEPVIKSIKNDVAGPDEILDVMLVQLINTDLFAGIRCFKTDNEEIPDVCLDMGYYYIQKRGETFLKDKCHINLQVERNMDTWRSHNVPDFNVYGTLARLEAVLNLEQYKLIRGFLAYNLGEDISDVSDFLDQFDATESRINLLAENRDEMDGHHVWTNNSLTFDLHDVSIWLQESFDSESMQKKESDDSYGIKNSLACIKFIKSNLKIDSFSDESQDVDLVSQEILIIDTRTVEKNGPIKNLFVNILQPIRFEQNSNQVQAEVHSRKRNDCTKYTILLNNMRLMAILDWLESTREFLAQNAEIPAGLMQLQKQWSGNQSTVGSDNPDNAFELTLNITDSELVFVEKANLWDTNAIILKSTTVVSYKPQDTKKVASINLNNLEVFSCVLGSEEDTALSIIDPVIINLDIRKNTLEINLQKQLNVRLSYNDVKLLKQMLESLPEQRRKNSNAVDESAKIDKLDVSKLSALGFQVDDCVEALETSNYELDEAALWLTQNAEPVRNFQLSDNKPNPLDIKVVELMAHRISICVIDDCKDADVPLLEISLSQLDMRQEIGSTAESFIIKNRDTGAVQFHHPTVKTMGFRAGHLKGIFSSDYYNRGLSGWEPLFEPWKCDCVWFYSPSLGMQQNRLQLKVNSGDMLKFNITSTAIELYELVHSNWVQDYYGHMDSSKAPSAVAYRRRNPFIPFALKNDTGLKLWFIQHEPVSHSGRTRKESVRSPDNQWQPVEFGETINFTFGQQNKLRHHDSHKLNLHQISVRLDGLSEVGPITIDKVGIYFRHAYYENDLMVNLPSERIVFAVSPQGSAQKLITVRSAIRLVNKLERKIFLKMEHISGHLNNNSWPQAMTRIVDINEVLNIPLTHVHAAISFLPLLPNIYFDNNSARFKFDEAYKLKMGTEVSNEVNIKSHQFSDKLVHWDKMSSSMDELSENVTCKSNRYQSFRTVVHIKREGFPKLEGTPMPGHLITLSPPLRLHNLLPCDLLFRLPQGTQGRISSSSTGNIHEINLEETVEITLTLDSYPGAGKIVINTDSVSQSDVKIRLTDTQNRVLYVSASISIQPGSGIQISVTAPYWLINKTGLPLIFRQEGVVSESAGQFLENEQARLVSPFMFSFSDLDSSPALSVRLGKRFGQSNSWCQPFNLHKDTLIRLLKASSTNEVFIIGVEIRRGRGRYSKTSIVTFSPRFQLYNRSSHKLQFAQKCYTSTMMDPLARATYIDAVPGCHLPFHWPRLEKDQLLCVRLSDIADSVWSGSIPIHETQSIYLNIRNLHGQMFFLRLEIVLHGATYFLIFSDAQALPPPIRIDNYSEVPMKFYQSGCRHDWWTTVKPHSSIAYALDEPMGSESIHIEAPGGVAYTYTLHDHGFSHNLTYENFIYIAFSGTFQGLTTVSRKNNTYDVEDQQLVLSIEDGHAVLARKQPGDRSQLWRMNQEQQLEHEGSSPPTEPGRKPSNSQRYVLDLEKAPQPTQYINLVVRPANKQRRSTQTWRFTEEGRLMCEHSNMCVQARDGFFGLRPGNCVVLGVIKNESRVLTKNSVPMEQAIERQKLRPGSGYLSVSVSMDGPIKTIQIKDIKLMSNAKLTLDPVWKHASHILPSSIVQYSDSNVEDEIKNKSNKSMCELHLNLNLVKGVGISVVSKRPTEELIFVTLENITFELIYTQTIVSLDMSVGDLQIDNQLFESPYPVMLYTIKNTGKESDLCGRMAALRLMVKMLPCPNTNAVIFEHFVVSLRPLAVFLEEKLILKLAVFSGLSNSKNDQSLLQDENDFEAQRVVSNILASNAKRYYFGDLQIVPSQIRLSVMTATKLSPELSEVKRMLGLTLIKFEDALIEFDKFKNKHHFETLEVYFQAIKHHYKQELKWQAASILGSVDFLGNPLGFASDVSQGVSGLLFEGSVKSFVRNVTHGISNSTAKLTETLSDGLGRVCLDEKDTETRQRILEEAAGTNSTEHLVAGLKGFSFGLLGGVYSIVKHTSAGIKKDGVQGILPGFGIGLLGTVTKPVIGVLDLASETANAVRETSKSSNCIRPERKRLPRCVMSGSSGLLPPFSLTQSKGQQLLFLINKRKFGEKLMAYEPCLYDGPESRLRLLVTTENVYVFSRTEDTTTIILSYHLSELMSCNAVSPQSKQNSTSNERFYYIELCLALSTKSVGQEMVKRPLVRCQSEEMATRACRHINYAKSVYDEREQTINTEILLET